MAKYNWNGMYRPNMFTPDNDKDQLADVQIIASVKDEDIVNDIVEEGIEINKATVSDILKRYQEAVIKRVLNGYAYSNSFVQMQPRITGVFESDTAPFDPSIHKCTVDMSAGSSLRAELANVGVKMIGTKDAGGAKIGSVTDLETGESSGVLTIGEMIEIDGVKIKIQDEKDEAQGVFFINSTGEHRATTRLAVNKPTQIMVKVPKDLAEGEIALVVRTKYTGSSTTLKAIREIKYNHSLKVVK